MNSRLLGAGIVVPILIVSIGIFIYNSASSTVTDSISSVSTYEIQAFNNQFIAYEGEQSGSNVKALMGRLIGNANTYIDESSKVPQVYIDKISEENAEYMDIVYTEFDAGDNTDYINGLNEVRTKLDRDHYYLVNFTYQESGLIDYIQISYDVENPIWEYKYR